MLPKGFLVGNLTADPQCGVASSNQNNYARFSVACHDIYSKPNSTPRTHFFNCISWGKRAAFVQSFLKKGDKIIMEYTLSTSSYTNQEGKLIKAIDLVVENIEFANARSGSQNPPRDDRNTYKEDEDASEDPSSDDEDDDITLDEIYSKN